jgi:signal transduction histidine kinase/ActR/RegA family two-component response regulator
MFGANMRGEEILVENSRLLQILAKNSAVALERVRLTESLRRHLEELQNTRQQLTAAEKLTAVGSLTCGIAHDFNNVLCGMIGQLQLLKSAPMSAEIRRRLDTVEGAAGRAAELTSGLLAFSRPQAHRVEPLDLDDRIRNVVDLLKVTLGKRITLELALETSGAPVLGDAGQLDQVILNLVANARDAMAGGGTLRMSSDIVGAERVPLAVDPEEEARPWVRFCVEDSGTGMSEDVVSRAFEPFYTTKKRGTGLGLSVLKRIVDGHGGACRVESEVGRGTRFEIFLPTTDQPPPIVAGLAAARRAAGERVLVVDDEEAIQDFVTAALESLGYMTHTACNGQEAIAAVKRLGDEVDLVLLDVDMPVMGGREACEELKRIQPDLKIVLTTGWMFSDDDMEGVVNATDGLLQKPFNLTTLSAKVAEVLTASTAETRDTPTAGQGRT